MKKNRVFLSYRRDDSPGYVSRLEEELEDAFGDRRVFRDATDIPGGSTWKDVIDANLHNSVVLILVIGPRWEQIWLERINDEVNYVALELQRAHELNVPIIPVTLDGTQLSKDLDLGSISFIYENQFHDLSDRQGRWSSDFQRLVSLLESVPGMGPARGSTPASTVPANSRGKSVFKWLAAVAGLFVVGAIWLGMSVGVDEPDTHPDPSLPTNQITLSKDNAVQPSSKDTNAVSQQQSVDVAERTTLPIAPFPLMTGTWEGQNGVAYVIQQYDDGTFSVESPEYGSGQGRFFTNMPGKFEIVMFDVGRGEFAVSNSSNRAMGWFIIDGRQEYGTLTLVE